MEMYIFDVVEHDGYNTMYIQLLVLFVNASKAQK